MVQETQTIGLSPEKIRDAQRKHTTIDPGCEKLTPEEATKWHPIGGMSWEERARLMKEAGVTEPNKVSTVKVPEAQLAVASN